MRVKEFDATLAPYQWEIGARYFFRWPQNAAVSLRAPQVPDQIARRSCAA